jgi:D-hexose-6-phosphate mutarotase
MTGSYEFRLRVALNPRGDLILTSRIKNINGKPFQFTFAYHTYFSVSDIRYIAKWHFAQSYFHNFLGFLECKKAEKTNRKLASILSRVFFLRHE